MPRSSGGITPNNALGGDVVVNIVIEQEGIEVPASQFGSAVTRTWGSRIGWRCPLRLLADGGVSNQSRSSVIIPMGVGRRGLRGGDMAGWDGLAELDLLVYAHLYIIVAISP